jgi:mercuric reductase
VLRWILRAFAERGGPIPVSAVEASLPEWSLTEVRDELAALDAKDLILLAEHEIPLAYPFSATSTPFLVTLADGRERFACCATDALGIAAMLGTRILIRSRCHHCGEPLELAVDPTGPLDAGEAMVWVGKRDEGERRACTSL